MSTLARLGLFIFAALMILAAAIYMIGDRQFMFSTTYRLQVPFDTVAGLANGAEVRIGGVRKGTVYEIHMPTKPGEKMMVIMDLESSTHKVIKKDSVASIQTEGLLGNKFLAISFGSEGAEPVHNGDTIQSQPPLDFSDLMKKTSEIMDTTSVALRNVTSATANMDAITAKVKRGEGTVGALINDKKVYEEMNTATADVRKTVEEAKVGMTAFQENMQALKKNWFFRGFFKNRGYQDSTELTKHEIAKLPDFSPSQKFTYNAKDIFDKSDTAKLKNEKSLNRVGQFLEKNPFGLVVVAGYTGLNGDTEENLILSQARAMVVRQYLAEKFKLDDSRIKTKGIGEDEKAEADKANRVEILVYPEAEKSSATVRERHSGSE